MIAPPRGGLDFVPRSKGARIAYKTLRRSVDVLPANRLHSSAMPKHSAHILDLAKRGAEHRYQELKAEIVALMKAFPDLRDSFDADELPIAFRLRSAAERPERKALRRSAKRNAALEQGAELQPRKRRTLSAAARRKISLAQKRRWAKEKATTKPN